MIKKETSIRGIPTRTPNSSDHPINPIISHSVKISGIRWLRGFFEFGYVEGVGNKE